MIIRKYINLYSHKRNTQDALWQRYINSQLFLGDKMRLQLLAIALLVARC